MERVSDASQAAKAKVNFKEKAKDEIDKKNQHRVIWSVLIFVFVLFLIIGLANFQAGRSFNVPASIDYRGALYQTEGEVVTGEGLVKTGDKVDNLPIYVKQAKPGKPLSMPVHRIYAKAGEDFIIYFLKGEEQLKSNSPGY